MEALAIAWGAKLAAPALLAGYHAILARGFGHPPPLLRRQQWVSPARAGAVGLGGAVLAYLLPVCLLLVPVEREVITSQAIVEPAPGTPAAAAGIRTGDRVVAIDGRPVASFTDLQRAVASGGERLELVVERDSQQLTFGVNKEGGRIGVRALVTRTRKGLPVTEALRQPARVVVASLGGFVRIFTRPREGELMGPVGIVQAQPEPPGSALYLAVLAQSAQLPILYLLYGLVLLADHRLRAAHRTRAARSAAT